MLKLSDRQDGYAFYYGQYNKDGTIYHVNVMPPAYLWDGDIKMEDSPPDETDWIIYIDGEEVARVRRRDDIQVVLTQALP